MNWLGLLQWVATVLLPISLVAALWLAYTENRRAATAERAVQQIADAIRYATKRANNSTKEDTHD